MVRSLLVLFFLSISGVSVATNSNGYAVDSSSNITTAASKRKDDPFMIVAGMTAAEELCLAVTGERIDSAHAAIGLLSCAAAAAAGDGQELFIAGADGQLLSALGKQCVGVLDTEMMEGSQLVLQRCDDVSAARGVPNTFHFQGNGQVKLGSEGQYCLSNNGGAVRDVDVALFAAASASSTRNAVSHGSQMAVDGHELTFWVSRFINPKQPVEFFVDWGHAENVKAIELMWEVAPKDFSVLLANVGSNWDEVFTTRVNVISLTRFRLHSVASKAKVLMTKPRYIHGKFCRYGINTFSVLARRLQAVVEHCDSASERKDARDKFFLTHVAEFEGHSSDVVQNELPMLDAAVASLSAATAELTAVLPDMMSCHGSMMFSSNKSMPPPLFETNTTLSLLSRNIRSLGLGVAVEGKGEGKHKQSGVDLEHASRVFEASRSAIIEAKSNLI